MSMQRRGLLKPHFTPEYEWLKEVSVTEEVTDTVSITWSAHPASQTSSREFDAT